MTTDLERSAQRSECARQVSADLEEQFRHDIAGLLNAAFSHDQPTVKRVLARMVAAPNAADEINLRCPAPIVGSHASSTTLAPTSTTVCIEPRGCCLADCEGPTTTTSEAPRP